MSAERGSMSHTALLPCWFCGRKPKIGKGGPGGIVWYISCERGEGTHREGTKQHPAEPEVPEPA